MTSGRSRPAASTSSSSTSRAATRSRLAAQDGRIDLRVDGKPWSERIPALEHAGEAANGEDYVVQAERLDGDLWEVRASPL